jgi:hypothetical protein
VISEQLSINIYHIYRKINWWELQHQQLVTLLKTDPDSRNLNPKSFEHWDSKDLFNVRFKPENVRIYPDPVLFSEDDIVPSNHYNLPDLIRNPTFQTPPVTGGIAFGNGGYSDDEDEDPKIIVRNYNAGMRELPNIHYALQKAFKNYLKLLYPGQQVEKECLRQGYRTRIDLVKRNKGKDVFYEVKTYPDVLISICVAIGQLLEYQFFPNQSLASELVIVTHLNASKQIYNYLEHLFASTGVRIGLVCFDHINKKVMSSNIEW